MVPHETGGRAQGPRARPPAAVARSPGYKHPAVERPDTRDQPADADDGTGGSTVSDEGTSDTGHASFEVPLSDRITDVTETFIRYVEVAAAAVFAVLFAIGVVDLTLQIGGAVQSGTITDPRVVIGFIDTGLLLLIIVEVYQTVVAYTQESDTRRIVRLVIYTGVIAMVRKVIIFRTGEYPSVEDALLAAISYTIVILGLVGLLYAERAYDPESFVPGGDGD
jgi:uncharacterized membrane protein (DUF373 family)